MLEASHDDDADGALDRADMLEEHAPEHESESEEPRTTVVAEPAVGFFIAGSALAEMNGVYVRHAPPQCERSMPYDDLCSCSTSVMRLKLPLPNPRTYELAPHV